MSTRFRSLPAVLLCAALAAPALAADSPVLTLEEAIRIAVEQNDRLGAADASVAAAGYRVQEASGSRLPKVDLAETVSRTTNPVYVFMNKLGQEAFTAADFDIGALNTPDAISNFNTMLEVQQPIYVGGRITHGIAAAKAGREAAAAGRERTRQEVVGDVIDSYTGAVLAEAHLKVARQALETAGANVGLVRNLREAGLVVESDLLQAEVRKSEVEEMVANAEAAVATARAALNLTMGRDLTTPTALPETIVPPPADTTPLEDLVAEARSKRPDLDAASRQVDAAAQAARMARGGYLPEVGVTGRYEANAESFIGTDGTNWSLFLGARWTVFDGRRTAARVGQARAQARMADRMRTLLGRAVELQVRKSWHELAAARKRLDQAHGAVDLARESLRIVRDRYGEGLATAVELLDAETSLTGARTREVGALRDVTHSSATLDLAVGRL